MQREQTDEKSRAGAGCWVADGSFTLNSTGCCEASALVRFCRCFLITVVCIRGDDLTGVIWTVVRRSLSLFVAQSRFRQAHVVRRLLRNVFSGFCLLGSLLSGCAMKGL